MVALPTGKIRVIYIVISYSGCIYNPSLIKIMERIISKNEQPDTTFSVRVASLQLQKKKSPAVGLLSPLKKVLLVWCCLWAFELGVVQSGHQELYAQDIPGVGDVTGLVSRAIKAIDLKIQRLQNKTIALQNAQKLIENAMAKLHLEDIASWVSRQKQLYSAYFAELGQVKAVLTTYWQVKDIISRQASLLSEYKRAWTRLKTDSHFSIRELSQIYQVYEGILAESLRNLDQLTIACDVLTTKMTDGQRMALITEAGQRIEKNLADLRRFNTRNYRLSLGRAVDAADALMTRKVYGL